MANEWDALTKEEMWNTIQEIRTLVNSDGTQSIVCDIERFAESYHERRMKEAEAILDTEPNGMIAGGMPGPMSLNAQLKRCESYHASQCAKCTRRERKYYPMGQEPFWGRCESCIDLNACEAVKAGMFCEGKNYKPVA